MRLDDVQNIYILIACTGQDIEQALVGALSIIWTIVGRFTIDD